MMLDTGLTGEMRMMMSDELKDSGARREFPSGAVRDRAKGKGRFDLMPLWPLLAYSAVLEAGAVKYPANNWRKGMPISQYIDSALRHLLKYQAGYRDEPHLWQALWNVAGAVYTQCQIYLGNYPAEFNDLYSDLNCTESPSVVGEFEMARLEDYRKMSPPPAPKKDITSEEEDTKQGYYVQN